MPAKHYSEIFLLDQEEIERIRTFSLTHSRVGGKWTCQAKIPGPQKIQEICLLIQLIHSNDASSGIGAAAQLEGTCVSG